MGEGSHSAQIVRFGVFEADLGTGELHKNGVKVPLQGQPFQVFAILLEHWGELVTREELRQRVWPKDTFVDFDHGLNTAITKIRIALGDDADNPRFVQTLPRRGYRFIVPVDRSSLQVSSPSLLKRLFQALRLRLAWVAPGVALLIVLSTVAIWRFSRRLTGPHLSPVEVVPLVALPGKQGRPAISPDGNQVAYPGYYGPKTEGIYTTLIGGEKSLRLTQNPGDRFPTWSPDGRQIAFVRYSKEGMSINVISALGGLVEHRLYTGPGGLIQTSGGLDWSTDGRVLAFAESSADAVRSHIALLSFSDLTVRPITLPPETELDGQPAFSPDGLSIAFVRQSMGGGGSDVFIVPVIGGEPKRLTFDNSQVWSAVWTQDGSDIVFSSARGGLMGLWRISASGGTSQPVTGVGPVAIEPSISRKGNQLVYLNSVRRDSIWRIDLRDKKHVQGSSAPVISARGFNWRPDFSPDGKHIVFESDRLGYSDIWYCNSDGTNCAQLTSLQGTAGTARWSPDGQYIAFEFHRQEYYEIYVVEVPGGRPRLVPTFRDSDNGAPSWSRDGQWIYFYSDHEKGPFQLWKVPLKGGTPVQVTRNGGVYAIESNNGRFLYYAKYEQAGIWRMPVSGGEEVRILEHPGATDWFNWELSRNGIYFLNSQNSPTEGIEFFDFETGETTPIFALQRRSTPSYGGLTVSPDGRSLLYGQSEFESYIMLVRNFH
jgi:Tol biopolymer transport system component/DNA-binding winged helix-turn-helix (wHTH) protein